MKMWGDVVEIARYKKIQFVQLIIIILNLAVSISKIIIGYIIRSVSMTADGLHSMADGLNNVVGMIGIYFAFQPIDEKHPYGHRKFETMTTLFIAVLLILTAYSVLKGAYDRIIDPVAPTVNTLSFLVMIFTIIINIFVNRFEKKQGKILKSEFLLSDAKHTLSDVFVSISVMGTLLATKFGYLWVDIVVSIFIAILILRAALDIIKSSANVLCDAVALDPEDIFDFVCEFDDVYSCHKIRSRGLTDDIHLDLHVVAKEGLSLDAAHLLIHNIDNALKKKFPGVTDVNVHVDPYKYYVNKTNNLY
jgi:cation diffusion facilitator family transporter